MAKDKEWDGPVRSKSFQEIQKERAFEGKDISSKSLQDAQREIESSRGSDKKLDNLKKAIASMKAKKKSKSPKLPPEKDPSFEMGKRNRSNPGVDLNDPAANVKKYGREFTAPKGRKGTSYNMPKKRGK